MRRLDFERTPLRNLFNKETPGRILYRKWSNSVAFEGGWWKAYGLSVLCFGLLILFWIWTAYSREESTKVAVISIIVPPVILILYAITRFQLGALPALTVVKESRESLWVHFRMTLAGGHTAAFAMFWFAFDRTAIPLVVISTPFVFGKMYLGNAWVDIHPNLVTIIILFVVMILFYGLLGLLLSGLGFIGVMIKKSRAIVIGAVVVPLIISLIAAGGGSIVSLFSDFNVNLTAGSSGFSPWLIFIAPENLIINSLVRSETSTMFSPVMISWEPIIQALKFLLIIGAIVWVGLWGWLKYSLPDPHLEKQL